MNRLSPLEHAKAKGKMITMSVSDRGPAARERMIAWLDRRPGAGWFYVQGDNFYFGVQADATAFKQWLMSELV